MSEHLRLTGVTHGYGDRRLFTAVDLAIGAGEHVAVVGENGAGKSTLLRILAGLETPDEGAAASHGRVGYLAQTTGLPTSFTVGNAIDDALASLRAVEAELDLLESGLADADEDQLERYGNLQTVYQLREGYAAESRVEAALDRLGLGGLDSGNGRRARSPAGNSTGWRWPACWLIRRTSSCWMSPRTTWTPAARPGSRHGWPRTGEPSSWSPTTGRCCARWRRP